MKVNLNVKPLIGAALVAVVGFSGTASANVVDLFTDPSPVPQIAQTGAIGTVFNQFGPATSILGGYRDIVVQVLSNPLNGIATARAGNGSYSFSTDAALNAIGKIQWDGNDNSATLNTTGLNHANLVQQVGCPASGCTSFVTDVIFADQTFTYSIGVYTNAANYSILTSGAPGGIVSSTPADFDFSWWLLATGDYLIDGVAFHIDRFGTGPNFSDVGALEFVLNSDGSTISVDLGLGAITKQGVPEPGTLALLGLGLVGATLGGRRRKQVAA